MVATRISSWSFSNTNDCAKCEPSSRLAASLALSFCQRLVLERGHDAVAEIHVVTAVDHCSCVPAAATVVLTRSGRPTASRTRRAVNPMRIWPAMMRAMSSSDQPSARYSLSRSAFRAAARLARSVRSAAASALAFASAFACASAHSRWRSASACSASLSRSAFPH